MKKIVLPLALLGLSATLLSFTTTTKKANYKTISSNKVTKILKEAGSFSQLEAHHYTGDRGSWSRRWSTYSLTDDNQNNQEIQKVLAN